MEIRDSLKELVLPFHHVCPGIDSLIMLYTVRPGGHAFTQWSHCVASITEDGFSFFLGLQRIRNKKSSPLAFCPCTSSLLPVAAKPQFAGPFIY